MKTVIDLVNEPFGSMEVEDTFPVKTINGIHYVLSPEDENDLAERAALHEAQAPIRALNEVYEKRIQGYGSIGSQLDMIYHDGIDAWKAHIESVKEQFPKP